MESSDNGNSTFESSDYNSNNTSEFIEQFGSFTIKRKTKIKWGGNIIDEDINENDIYHRCKKTPKKVNTSRNTSQPKMIFSTHQIQIKQKE